MNHFIQFHIGKREKTARSQTEASVYFLLFLHGESKSLQPA